MIAIEGLVLLLIKLATLVLEILAIFTTKVLPIIFKLAAPIWGSQINFTFLDYVVNPLRKPMISFK